MTDQPKMKLTNEQRAKVAAHCLNIGRISAAGYKEGLIIKTAQLILNAKFESMTHSDTVFKYISAIATNNIADIEALCFELIGEGL